MPRDATTRADLLTIPEAAQRAGVSPWTVKGWIARGQLPSVRIDRRRRIHPDALAAARDAAQLRRVGPAWRRNPQRAGRRLRRLREAAGLNQQELAARSGLTHEEISRLELGHQAPLIGTVRDLARAFEVAPSVFVARTKIAPVGLTTEEVAARLEVPAEPGADLAAPGAAGWDQGLRRLAGATGSGRRPGTTRAVARALPAARPALPRLSGRG